MRTWERSKIKTLGWTGLFEGVQYVMPSRTFNWYDVVANGVGVVVFVFIWVLFIIHRRKETEIRSEFRSQRSEVD